MMFKSLIITPPNKMVAVVIPAQVAVPPPQYQQIQHLVNYLWVD